MTILISDGQQIVVLFYVDITTQDNDNVGHELPSQILNLARKWPPKGK